MHCRTNRHFARRGFTLVELLTVIAIIGILVGLLIPAVGAIRRSVRLSAFAMEVKAIDNAVEQFKNKYGDYPADGSDKATFTRVLRKAFPNMAPTEITLLAEFSNWSNRSAVGIMDPAEALVFFLGGFSDDPAYPISGPGGPIFVSNSGLQVNSSAWSANSLVQYNSTRNNPLYDFGQGNLAIEVVGGLTVSNDEAQIVGGTNDLMPTYSLSGTTAPVVYFDSRTYAFSAPSQLNPRRTVRYYNSYAPAAASGLGGVARPYKSEEIATTILHPGSPPGPQEHELWQRADMHFKYANAQSFQLICAGLDEDYGGIPRFGNGAPPVFYRYASGSQLDIGDPTGGSGFSRYTERSGEPSAQLDNVVNFADSTLENAIDQ